MSILGKDSLQEASSGVSLSSHTPSGTGATGGTWTIPTGASSNLVSLAANAGFTGISGQVARGVQTNTVSMVPDSVSATLNFGASAIAGPLLAVYGNDSKGYFVDRGIAGAWRLYKTDGASNTSIGTIGHSFSTGVDYTITISRTVSGSSTVLAVDINGTSYGPFTDDGTVLGASYRFAMIGGLLSFSGNQVTFKNYERNGPGAATLLDYSIFGDSITAGFGVSSAWPALLASDIGLIPSNYAVSGSQAMDQAIVAYTKTPKKSLVMLGTNDQRTGGYGSNATYRGYWVNFMRAVILWNALPTKTLAQAATVTSGSWTNNNAIYGGGIDRSISSSGAKLTFSNISGSTIYLGYTVQNGQTGTWKVTVDSVDVATGGSAGTGIATVNGGTFGPACIRISGLSSGSHTVVFETTNSGLVYCDWVAGIGNQSSTNSVLVGNVISPNATGFSSFGVNEANVGAFNTALSSLITDLISDGVLVRLVDLHSLTISYQADGLHPNQTGQQQIADKFSPAIISTDTTAPVISSAAINSAGSTLTLAYTETETAPMLPATGVTGYTLASSTGVLITVSSGTISGATVTLTLSRQVYDDETITYSYSQSTGNVTDTAGNEIADQTNASVTNGSTVTPSITGVSTDAVVLIGSASSITWSSAGIVGNVDILLSTDNGSTFPIIIASGTANDGSYSWTPESSQLTATGVIRVRSTSNNSYHGTHSVKVATTEAMGSSNTDLWYTLKALARSNGIDLVEQ